MRIIWLTDGSLVWDLQRPHSGTAMPSGAVHPNRARSTLGTGFRWREIPAWQRTCQSGNCSRGRIFRKRSFRKPDDIHRPNRPDGGLVL